MSGHPPLRLALSSESETCRLAEMLAAHARPGDTILLDGPIGAGKTHFCRAFIRARLGHDEEVPSPTFTLVQTYDGDVDIWHADLFRLHSPDEVTELGLIDAFSSAICLIEWPDRLGSLKPRDAVRLSLRPTATAECRLATIDLGNRQDLRAALAAGFPTASHSDQINAFVAGAGWGPALRRPLAGDASARRYERLSLPNRTAILMDAEPTPAESTKVFARIDRYLRDIGLSAPAILAEDHDNDFLLLEDLGDGVFARLVKSEPKVEPDLYAGAVDVLLHLQSHPPAAGLKDLSASAWAEAAALAEGIHFRDPLLESTDQEHRTIEGDEVLGHGNHGR